MKSNQRWCQRHQLFNHPVPSDLSSWLFDDSSLTARMIGLCGEKFNVHLISQKWRKIEVEEASAMALKNTHSALVRQVLLCNDQQPLVYAKTIIPAITIQGGQRRYANMGSRPLGAMLFSDRTMRREEVQVAKLPPQHEAYRYTGIDEVMWGRRSVFRVSGKPILVGEYFLPELLRVR